MNRRGFVRSAVGVVAGMLGVAAAPRLVRSTETEHERAIMGALSDCSSGARDSLMRMMRKHSPTLDKVAIRRHVWRSGAWRDGCTIGVPGPGVYVVHQFDHSV